VLIGAPKDLIDCRRFFLEATHPKHRQYEALRAYFVDVKNIGKADVLSKIAEENDLPADEATDVLLSRKFKDAVDDDWRRCAAMGVNAVPTFLAGRYLMVGAQPYEELERLVQHMVQSTPQPAGD